MVGDVDGVGEEVGGGDVGGADGDGVGEGEALAPPIGPVNRSIPKEPPMPLFGSPPNGVIRIV